MEGNRAAWEKPELIVLVRNRPEEAVLAACKVQHGTGPAKNHCNAATGSGNCSDSVGT